MREAAAQWCSYYTQTQGINPGDFIGFGGMENVRFRSPVRPGARIVSVAKATRLNRRQRYSWCKAMSVRPWYFTPKSLACR